MTKNKLLSAILLMILITGVLIPVQMVQAASVDDIVKTLSSSTVNSPDNSKGLLERLFSLVFEKILGPILNIFGGDSSSKNSGIIVTPIPPKSSGSDTIQNIGILRGKVIVIDPGHGGTNPGAVANNTREADNNLAVGLKLREKLVQAGAKVIMTRDTDRNVAPKDSTLGQELQARVDIAEANKADVFVSLHSNSNPDRNIAGAMTFYPSGKSSKLALDVQTELIKATNAVDKGTAPATFLVLRNTSMPAILIEMGFVTNVNEAQLLQQDFYRNKVSQGIFNGLVKYFNH